MIKLFPANETEFKTAGLIVLNKYCKECTVKEILNGNFSADIKIDYFPKVWSMIEKQMIIVIPTHRGPKAFRVVHKKIDTRYMYIYAQHIWWDLHNNFIEDINIVGKKGQDAGQYILKRSVNETLWQFTSDITVTKNCRIVRQYVTDAFMGKADNTFKNRWGGELEVDDFKFSINTFRGSRVPKVIKYGKNVTGFEFYEDMSTVGTRLMPIAFDGMLLPEMYVDSPLISEYTEPIIRKVDAKSIKLAGASNTSGQETSQEEGFGSVEECYEAMRKLCKDMFENGIDKPTQNIRASIIELSKYDQYRQCGYQSLETIQLGDVVDVEMVQYNIVIRHRCISITYDALRKQYIETELGEFKVNEPSVGDDVVLDNGLDEALAEYYEGVYFHRNARPVSIDDQMRQVAYLTYGTTRDSHLSLFVTMVFEASHAGVLTCNLLINNDKILFTPKQSFSEGWTTFTFTMPILYVKSGKGQSLSLNFQSTSPLKIMPEQLQVTLRGQGVAKGGVEERPHAEIDETYNLKQVDFEKLICNDNVSITFIRPKITKLSEHENIDVKEEFNQLQATENVSIIKPSNK